MRILLKTKSGFFGGWTFLKFAMWYLYICEKDSKLYTGITTDLTNRSRQHKYPKLIHTETFNNRIDAAKRERQIKGWGRAKKLALANLKK